MDKITKKRFKRYITWACMAGVVLLLTVMPLLAQREAEKEGPQASILSATVESGSITTALHGGGTLEEEEAEDVIIPTGVKITGFLVKNGDIVQAGTPVAAVDKTSVMAAIASVNETMDFLREELEDGRDEMVASTITAVPGGRVKKIFAKEGETVQEVMLRDGALAVLSIDSMMAVKFETASALATGENVDVTLADGTVITGRVESNLDDTVVVTVDDEGYEVGSQVTVDGLGTGKLYIHNAWKATGYAGTISRVHAGEEKTLAAGANLFSLEDREFEGQLQYRANQHREYEELLQTLLKMYGSGTIDAPCEGIVSGIDQDSVHLLAAEGTWEIELLGGGEPAYRVVLLSNTSVCANLSGCINNLHDPGCSESCSLAKTGETCVYTGNGNHKSGCIEACTNTQSICNAAGDHKPGCITFCNRSANMEDCPNKDHTNHYAQCIHKCNPAAKIQAECPGDPATGHHHLTCINSCEYNATTDTCPGTGAHEVVCIKSCIRADAVQKCKGAQYPHYSDCIESCTVSPSANIGCPASKHKVGCFYLGMTYKGYGGIVNQVGNGVLVARVNTQESYDIEKVGSTWKITSGILNTYLMTSEQTISVGNASAFQPGDTILLVTGYQGDQAVWSNVVLYGHSTNVDVNDILDKVDLSGLMGGMNFDLSGMTGNFAGYGNYGGMAAQETEDLHDRKGSVLMTVIPHKTMKVTAAFDQQDISKVTEGMKATLKVEALKNQTFSGQVTGVGIHGTNNGGSSKFTADITVTVEGEMIAGMSTSVTLPLETKENVLIIPVAALDMLDGKTVVYTSLDKDTGEPAGPVEVVTGVSDGEHVEIISGLSLGDTVYYAYYDTLEEDTSAEAEKFTFG